MHSTGTWRKAPPLALFVLLVLLLSMIGVIPANAEGAPLERVPGYPKAGCYGLEVRGAAMWAGQPPHPWTSLSPGRSSMLT